jgi:hypothetical protein
MRELTHPVELRDEELDLIAAGGGKGGGHGGGHRCGCDGGSFINVEDNDILSHNNIVGVSVGSKIFQVQ